MAVSHRLSRTPRHPFGQRLTDADFIKYHYGPYAPDLPVACEELHARGILEEEFIQTKEGRVCHLKRPALPRIRVLWPTPYAGEVLDAVLEEWAGRPTDELVEFAKRTEPYVAAARNDTIDFSVGASVPFSEHQDIDWDAFTADLVTLGEWPACSPVPSLCPAGHRPRPAFAVAVGEYLWPLLEGHL